STTCRRVRKRRHPRHRRQPSLTANLLLKIARSPMRRTVFTLVVLLVAATSAFAFDDPGRRTIVVRDGNVLFDDFDFPGKGAFIGVSVVDLTPELREFFGASKDSGVLVSSVADHGPAAKAGVRVGDVITSVDGKAVASLRDL